MERYYLPKYVNALPQILWWEVDEFAFFMAGVVLGIWSDHSFIGAGIGVLLAKLYTKFKYAKQPGYLFHKLYTYGIYREKKRIPPYWVKELVE